MITSYAQNFEDVILWRALKSVERGFYIDIGAQDPVVDSVSLTFYEQGWRGLHVEPAAVYAAKIRGARPDEEVIEAAIGTGTSPLLFYEFPGTGLSTADPAIARQHADFGFEMKECQVPVVSLQSFLDSHTEREVHWLKIDVEGMESAVIESWGTSAVRPWIVVVESTLPITNKQSYERWDPHLKGLGYEFVYFDGLNRFYVVEEHPELKASFGPGPNIFDEFAFPANAPKICAPTRQQLALRDAEIQRLRQQIVDTDISLQQRDAEIDRLSECVTVLNEQVRDWAALTDAFQNSTSWRLTAPFRGLKYMTRTIVQGPKDKGRLFMSHALLWVGRHPRARLSLRRIVRRMPALERRLLLVARSRPSAAGLDGRTRWMMEPEPAVLAEWKKILRKS